MKDRVVVLTGGAGFLGGHFVKALIKEGASVIVFDKQIVRTRLAGVTSRVVDITDQKSVADAMNSIESRIDVLINNAAMNPVPGSDTSKKQFAPYEDYDLELWKKEIDVGLTGAQICTQEAVRVMLKGCRRGSIINIGSHYGLVSPEHSIYAPGSYKSIAYATIKGALLNFTRAWAGYLGPMGIRVNCLVFGGVKNGQDQEFINEYSKRTMLHRMARPDEYNEGLIFLASDASSYMTGQTLIMDGGWTAM